MVENSEKKVKKSKNVDDKAAEVKYEDNLPFIALKTPLADQNGLGFKVKKSKGKKRKAENDEDKSNENIISTENTAQPVENGIKSKKSKKNKEAETKISEEKPCETTDSAPTTESVKTPAENGQKMYIGKNLKQSLIAENAYISGLFSLINFPKRDNDDDDNGVYMNKGKPQKMINRKGGAQSVSELQQRLKAKLESLQGPKSDKPGKSDRKKLSKQEKKAKMMEEKKLASKMAKIRQNAAASSATAPATTNGVSKAKPVFNAEGKVVYSKFDLGTKSTINGQGTAANTSNPKKDPKAALASIQKQKEKLKKMEDKGETEIAKNMKESSAWTKALDKTEGVKVKDDVGLLKKSIKKQEQKKKSSAKKWTERRGDEKKKKDERQQKRTDNIKKRKTDVKANKMKKLAKRGRVPGFK